MAHKQQTDIGGAQVRKDTSDSGFVRTLLRMIGLSHHHREQGHDAERASTLQSENEQLQKQIESVSERESNVRYLATHDGLTGLANRSLLMDRYIQAAAHAHRSGNSVALLVFDVDGFKHVNDTYGHLVGDRLLQQIAGVLEGIVSAGDTACRYGGDEFMLLLGSIDDASAAETIAHKVAIGIVDALRAEGIELDVTASCGIAMYPEHGSSWRSLAHAADQAMYQHKAGAFRAAPSAIEARSDNGGQRPMASREAVAGQSRSSESPLMQEPGFAGGDGAGRPPQARAGDDA